MPPTAPFAAHADRYDRWFDDHQAAYRSELAALRRVAGPVGDGLSVGVGTGRFAAPLDVGVGLDPTPAMLARARERGVAVVQGVGEALPFAEGAFDTVLVVTTVCFVDDLPQAVAEAARVLRADGQLLVGFVDADSPLGRRYEARKADNPFYRDATFVTSAELRGVLADVGFDELTVAQTIFEMPEALSGTDRVTDGFGEGSFVAIRARPPAATRVADGPRPDQSSSDA